MSNEQSVEWWQNIVNNLEDQLETANEGLREAKISAAPVKVGDIVVVDKRAFGSTDTEECQVVEVLTNQGSVLKPWLRVFRKKKNGEWGSKSLFAYQNWELKK